MRIFYGTLGVWDTEPVEIELKIDSKHFNCKYDTLPRINKDNFQKELEILVKIEVSTMVQHYQYINTVFITPKKEGTARFITHYHRLNHK